MSGKFIFIFVLFLFLLSSSLNASSPWLGRDKVMHFLASTYVTYWTYGVSYDAMNQSNKNSLMFAVSLTTLAGFGKEYSDKKIGTTGFNWYDMAYNGAGILTGLILINNLR